MNWGKGRFIFIEIRRNLYLQIEQVCLPCQARQATATWDKLPVYQLGAQGQKIVYTVTEAQPAGYQEPAVGADTGNDADGHAFEVTNTQDTTSLTAVKTWGSDPANIGRDVAGATIALQRSADGTAWSDLATQEVKKTSDSQQVTWTGLSTHDADGNAYSYRAVEESLDLNDGFKLTPTGAESGTVGGYDYTASTAYTPASDEQSRPCTGSYATIITNTPASGSLKVTKTWTDDNNRDNLRSPVKATLSAKAGGDGYDLGSISLEKTLSADGWSCTWDGLPVCYPGAEGDQVHYRVVEAPVSGYSSRYDASDITGTATDADAHRAVTVTNSLDPVTYSFAKTDDAGTPLAGTTLTMTGTFANADGSTAEETRTVLGGDTSQDLTGNSLVKGASYTLEEAAATEGYTYAKDATLAVGGDGSLSVNSADAKTSVSSDGHGVTVADSPTTVTVHIDADGAVSVSGEAPASYALDTADDGAYVFTCSDEPFVLKLLKTDPNGTMLPDASFDVTGQFAGGPTGGSVKVGDEGISLVVTDQRIVENGTARTGDGLPIGAAAGLLSAALLALFAHLANRRKEE